MSTRYVVKFDDYTERHFIKNYKKKYSEKAWQITENAIRNSCMNFDELIQMDQCDEIVKLDKLLLCKLDFSVAGTGRSPKASGNRAIFVADCNTKKVKILLVYHKSDIVKSGNETVAWKKIVLANFPEYGEFLKL